MRLIHGVTCSIVLATIVFLSGCMHPQIMDPLSTGFADDEYLVIRITDTDQLGQLYYALPDVDDKGNPLPLCWRGTTKLLFPTSDTVNKVKTTTQEQVRYAFEKVGGSGKFTAAAIVELSANSDAAYKYESKSQGAARIDMTTLQFATPATDLIRAKLLENPKYHFAFMSAIYQGTAFVEVLSNVKSAGGGSYAAFQLGGDYYASKNKNIATSGPIIFQLTQIDPREVGIDPPPIPAEPIERKLVAKALVSAIISPPAIPAKPIERKLSPISTELLHSIKESLPDKLKNMLE